MVKNPPVNAGDTGDTSSIPGSGRSPGGDSGNPLQYSCLENPMDRGAWFYISYDCDHAKIIFTSLLGEEVKTIKA